MESITDILKLKIDGMTPNQKRLTRFVTGNLDKAAFFNIVELSENSGISASSITRFCKMLGFERFTDFQKELRKNWFSKIDNNNDLSIKNCCTAGNYSIKNCLAKDINSINRLIRPFLERVVYIISFPNLYYRLC